jgi:hypothetical protein
MRWAVKPKTQIFEGLGWCFYEIGALQVGVTRTINEHGKTVVRPVNKPLTIWRAAQPEAAAPNSVQRAGLNYNQKAIRGVRRALDIAAAMRTLPPPDSAKDIT